LNAASSNREYDIIRGHMEADTVAKSVLEDEILDALEAVDRMQIEVAGAEKRAADARREKERCAQQVSLAEGGLRAQAEQLSSQVREAEKVLSGDTAIQYRRLVEAYGADALAAVDGRICTNCYTAITPQNRVALNSGQIKFCECGRLLYLASGE
ncbi:MAG: zinc ribbon domain-containing protein, partial [Planctomycetaceae bacterium]